MLHNPWIFLNGMKHTRMTIMNLSWDIMSDLLVRAIGLFYFREQITRTKLLGVGFALTAAFLFSVS